MDTYRAKILDLIKRTPDLDLKAASLAIGKNHSYLYQFIHRAVPRKLDGDDRRKLAMVLNVSESELMPEGEAPSNIKAIDVIPHNDNEFVDIPVYDVSASAGHGLLIDQENIIHHVNFRFDWLRSITRAPINQLCVIRVDGDSMLPTLTNDDTVLVDMTQTYPRKDGIYVVRYDGTLMVKRVQIDPVRNIATIISDNVCYQPIHNLVPEEIKIAGRVIWLGRRV
jgi:phage repressor protein C with HTH and peptisase S24 domain